ncbi:hypothetical protein AAFF_G00086230 [Aldrovandia affinis]|uniref:Uncharacterized protein n=1 Tax=Aldrovandia affinis TaxID=143900 RepID=A0AAD7RWJ5_9TELE|nr:hypothetical protein AAFF_G00086230 [Aldrovandia affinis]
MWGESQFDNAPPHPHGLFTTPPPQSSAQASPVKSALSDGVGQGSQGKWSPVRQLLPARAVMHQTAPASAGRSLPSS